MHIQVLAKPQKRKIVQNPLETYDQLKMTHSVKICKIATNSIIPYHLALLYENWRIFQM